MPTYEYACKSCGQHHEVVQSFTDPSLTECPACSGPLRKVFGSIGITFKGDGFYKTDSRSSAKAGSGNGSSSDKADSSGGGSGDSKPSTPEKKSETSASGDTKKKEPASTSGSSDSG